MSSSKHRGIAYRSYAYAYAEQGIAMLSSVLRSPSAAGKAVLGRSAEGWVFWQYNKGVQWVPMSDLRK